MKYSILVKILLIILFWIGSSDLQVSESYHQFVKLSAFAGFCWLAYYELRQKRAITGILCIGAVILFNPFYTLNISSNDWQNIEVLIIPALLVWLVVDGIVALVRRLRKPSQTNKKTNSH